VKEKNLALKFKILSSGAYLPKRCVTSAELQERMSVSQKWIEEKTGVVTRYHAEDESIASMASKAVTIAMARTNLTYKDIDLIIAAGGTPDQPIPHNSGLIHKELDLPSTVTAFDVNATCLSFVQALKVSAAFLSTGTYRKIIIVSSEKPSVGLDYESPESAALLGDGAVAFVLESTEEDKGILFSEFTTHSDAIHLTEIPAGGTRVHPKYIKKGEEQQLLFNMDGKAIFKKTSQLFPSFVKETMKKHDFKMEEFQQFIPHQASMLGLKIMEKKLNLPKGKLFVNIQKYGNLVGASIPMGIHEAMKENKIIEGDKFLILATAAGLTLGICAVKI
jgi:3-oxoacyl-[acyl-carrier-protein] synthase-3